MALLQVNAHGRSPRLHRHPDHPLDSAISKGLARIPATAPITILIHGYKFSPYRAPYDPHTHIFALAPSRPCWKALSWPAHLGFTAHGVADGLCIAFGWDAKARINALGLPRVYGRAADAAAALRALIVTLSRHAPGRPIDLVAHSLGSRVALLALHEAPAVIGRVILMAGADYRSTALRALRSPAGQRADFVNVLSTENAIYDLLFQAAVPAPVFRDRSLGHGLPGAPRNWLDLSIDCEATRAALAQQGVAIAPRNRIACHWSVYLRPGIFQLYAALIRDRARWSVAALRDALPSPIAPAHPAAPSLSLPDPTELDQIARVSHPL